MKRHSNMILGRVRRCGGLTLVELMVAMLLSLLLMTGVMTIFAGSKTTSQLQTGLATVQENGRHALYTMVRDIRGAGFSGCAGFGPTAINILANDPPEGIANFTGSEILFGIDNVAGGNIYGAVPGSDVIRVRGAGDSLIGLVGNTVPVNANIQTTVANGYFQADDILVITDCEATDIFRATTVSQSGTMSTISHSNSNNTSNFLSKPYEKDATVMKFRSNTYYVADTGRINAVGDPVFALYGVDTTVAGASAAPSPSGGFAVELADGVEDMQVTYGVDADGNGLVDRFVVASGVADWGDVLAVRLSLLVSSVENAHSEAVTYTFNGATTTPTDPTDFKLRQEMASTITIRNQVN